jgi:HEAT repeat-containing protein 5
MLFASPDGYACSSVQAAIASSSGTFSSVWQSADGYAYGVTFNEIVDLGGIGLEGDPTHGTQDYLNRDDVEVSIDSLVRYLLFFFNFFFKT